MCIVQAVKYRIILTCETQQHVQPSTALMQPEQQMHLFAYEMRHAAYYVI